MKRTDGSVRSEDAQMVISDRKWSPALQWEENAGGFEAIVVIDSVTLAVAIYTYKKQTGRKRIVSAI